MYNKGTILGEGEYATLIGEERMVLQGYRPYRHSFSLTYCYLLYDKKVLCGE